MIGSIVGGGFRLIGRRPLAVAAWALMYLAVTVAMFLVMRSMITAFQPPVTGTPFGGMTGATLGRFALLELVALVVMVVVMTAVQRAVLQPERSAFAYMRLGMDELRMFALAVILFVVYYILMLIAMLVLALVASLIGVAAGMGAAATVGIVMLLGVLALTLVFEVRFALAFPLTLMRGKIIIGDAWRITRGRFWTLLGAFLLLTLILIAVVVAAALVSNGGYFADMIRSRFSPAGAAAAQQAMLSRQFSAVNGTVVFGWIVNAFAGTLALVLFGGGVATAARELTGNTEEIAETFA